jgi:hypothetical protein
LVKRFVTYKLKSSSSEAEIVSAKHRRPPAAATTTSEEIDALSAMKEMQWQ